MRNRELHRIETPFLIAYRRIFLRDSPQQPNNNPKHITNLPNNWIYVTPLLRRSSQNGETPTMPETWSIAFEDQPLRCALDVEF